MIGCGKSLDGNLKCKQVPTRFGSILRARSTLKWLEISWWPRGLLGSTTTLCGLCAVRCLILPSNVPSQWSISFQRFNTSLQQNEILATSVCDEAVHWREKLTSPCRALFEAIPGSIQDELLLERGARGNAQVWIITHKVLMLKTKSDEQGIAVRDRQCVNRQLKFYQHYVEQLLRKSW